MRIDGIEIYRVGMPLIYPFRTAFGNDEIIEIMHGLAMCGMQSKEEKQCLLNRVQ